jgi:hypothetical protein
MVKIPIEFDYNGEHYKGHFSQPFGTGGSVWHLMIDNFYFGQLLYSETNGWSFHDNKGMMQDMADYFGNIVMLWYE